MRWFSDRRRKSKWTRQRGRIARFFPGRLSQRVVWCHHAEKLSTAPGRLIAP